MLSGKRTTLSHFPIALRSYAKQIQRALARSPVDVIFSPSSIPITLLKCEQPVVMWGDAVFHGMLNYYPGSFSNMTNGAITRAKEQEEAALNRVTLAIYSSEWAASWAKRFVAASKVAVIPFGASLDNQRSETAVLHSIHEKRRLRSNRCNLLYCGVDWERKGGSIAVEVADLLNSSGIPTKLTIVGCQPPATLPEFAESLGFVEKDSPEGKELLRRSFEDADIFILPTKAEAAGIVFAEAAAFGLPCLTFDTGGTSEYVKHNRTGYCFSLDTSANQIANAAHMMISDPRLYSELAVNAYNEYKTRLNWDCSVSALICLLNEAARHKSQSRVAAPVACE
jgi:glycosyltransferase involved in cell wall biosynthesis